MKFILGIVIASLIGSVIAVAGRSFLQDKPSAVEVPIEPAAPVVPSGVPLHNNPGTPPVPPPSYSGPGFVATALPERAVWVEGTMMRGRKVWAYLSDGRVFTENTPGLTAVDPQGLVIEGKRIWMRRTSPPQDLELPSGAASQPVVTAGLQALGGPAVDLGAGKGGTLGAWRLDSDGVLRLNSSSGGPGR